MKRREFITLLGGAASASRTPRAQQKATPVIGFLGSALPGPNAPNVAAFHHGLGETGYVEGQILRSNTVGQRAAMIGCPHLPPTSSAGRST
jgi:hypothetical protein